MSVVTLEEFLELLNEEQYVQALITKEMTTVRNKFLEYEAVSKRIPVMEKQIRSEVLRYYRQQLHPNVSNHQRFGVSSTCPADAVIRGPRAARSSLERENSSLAPEEGTLRRQPEYPRILPSTHYGEMTMRSNPTVDDSELVYEQRRLSQIVENVLCAYLNRHLLNPPREGDDAHRSDATEGRDEEYAALQAKVESRMPRAYQWAPQASLLPGTNLGSFHPSLVYLCAPFAQCVRAEAGIYFAFERLMTMIEDYNEVYPLPQRVASFLTLFRRTLPELHAYFEAEEVDLVAVITSWLQHLLAREMQIDDLMRLWGTWETDTDTYFAVPDLLDLHLYVCLAILTNCKDALEELDRSETTGMLFSLPPLDVDRVCRLHAHPDHQRRNEPASLDRAG
ncbi:hypothetical protein MOBT1_000154 [Malassezia obtusa]|uniref:Rab-GAP TBC domain-containing protein n=1 Tax=Malassezia obtusa TaxID=76774 RepID=A0AAF0IRU7_9BASI|nr:hypothetical protein MOBT1_000154 [Malassezia obtusa]